MGLMDIQNNSNFDTDKQDQHTYLESYEKLFKPYKDKKINILEIGILDGGSLKLWSMYFTNAKIYGADTFERVSIEDVKINLEGTWWSKTFSDVELVKFDSATAGDKDRDNFFNTLRENNILFDIIIDDGSHRWDFQVDTFNNFKPLLNIGGLYIIEDIWTTDTHKYKASNSDEELEKRIDGIEFIRNNKYANNTLGIYRK
jgi:hypothetical protein